MSRTHAYPRGQILLFFVVFLVVGGEALPEPVYTVHYVKSYRRDLIENNFGCGKAVSYGTYLYPLGPVDALYALMNGHVYGFNANCQRKDTYIKLFGEAQDYQQLINLGSQMGATLQAAIGRSGVKKVIIQWKYLPQGENKLEQTKRALESLVGELKNKGFSVFVKAPASFFCKPVGGKRYILDLPVENLIIELYGQEQGRYTNYDDIFGAASTAANAEGYSSTCPKFPTIQQLTPSGKKIYLQKTLDSSLPGFIGGHFEEFLQLAGERTFNGLYFYDGYPPQTVDL